MNYKKGDIVRVRLKPGIYVIGVITNTRFGGDIENILYSICIGEVTLSNVRDTLLYAVDSNEVKEFMENME